MCWRQPSLAVLPGHPSGGNFEYSGEQKRIFEKAVKSYVGRSMPGEVRRNTANVLAHYTADVHDILTVVGTPMKSRNEIAVNRAQSVWFIRQVAEDDEVFRVVYQAQAGGVTEELGKLHREEPFPSSV